MNIGYSLWLVGARLSGIVPAPIARRIARACGTLGYYLIITRQQVARENFAHVLGRRPRDPRVGRIAHLAFRNFAEYLYDMLHYSRVSLDEIYHRVSLDLTDAQRQAFEGDNPVIVISAHFGQLDWAGAVAAHEFRPFTLAAETIKPVEVFNYLARARARHRVHLVPFDVAPRRLIEALRRREMLGFMVDFGLEKHSEIPSVPVKFFGTWTRFTAVPAYLARKYHAPIIVAFPYLDARRHVRLFVSGPMWVSQDVSKDQAARLVMQEVARCMEPVLARYPEQWYVFRRLWPRPNEGFAVESENSLIPEASAP